MFLKLNASMLLLFYVLEVLDQLDRNPECYTPQCGKNGSNTLMPLCTRKTTCVATNDGGVVKKFNGIKLNACDNKCTCVSIII